MLVNWPVIHAGNARKNHEFCSGNKNTLGICPVQLTVYSKLVIYIDRRDLNRV